MAVRKSKVRLPTAEELSDAQLDELWTQWTSDRRASESDLIANALSGDDTPAARGYLMWLMVGLRDNREIPESSRRFAVAALERFHATQKITLGGAFGLENKRTGRRTRPGFRQAVVDLIKFLHERGYTLSHDTFEDSAFEVASRLVKRKWAKTISAKTLSSEQYWLRKD